MNNVDGAHYQMDRPQAMASIGSDLAASLHRFTSAPHFTAKELPSK